MAQTITTKTTEEAATSALVDRIRAVVGSALQGVSVDPGSANPGYGALGRIDWVDGIGMDDLRVALNAVQDDSPYPGLSKTILTVEDEGLGQVRLFCWRRLSAAGMLAADMLSGLTADDVLAYLCTHEVTQTPHRYGRYEGSIDERTRDLWVAQLVAHGPDGISRSGDGYSWFTGQYASLAAFYALHLREVSDRLPRS